jgi:hypothetical protein
VETLYHEQELSSKIQIQRWYMEDRKRNEQHIPQLDLDEDHLLSKSSQQAVQDLKPLAQNKQWQLPYYQGTDPPQTP